jgi:alkylresorcinol/alkylpyrone synthase
MRSLPRLCALATAVPPNRLDQEEVERRAAKWFRGAPDFDRLMPVFANSGIRRRYSAVPIDWFEEAHGWTDRNRAYLTTALDLIEIAAGRVLDKAGVALQDIGAIVTVSTTGIATPSLDALLIERMGLPRTAQRLPIFGLGCAGGALGLARAASLAVAMPDKPVLFLVVELCTLQFRRDDLSRSNIVATALFGDGAAAAVISGDGKAVGPAIATSGEYTWPQSLDVMGWDIAEDGLRAIFSRDIPRLVTGKLGEVADDFLDRNGLALCDIDRFVCHPGGPKVIEACETVFGLPSGALVEARHSLAEFGNMSAASVLFVLDRILEGDESAHAWRLALLTAFGPGFSAGFVVLEAS